MRFFLWLLIVHIPISESLYACKLHQACVLHHPELAEGEWEQVQKWISETKDFPSLLRRLIDGDQSDRRLVNWRADDPTFYEGALVGRRYLIKSRVEMGVTFSTDLKDPKVLHAFLTSFYPPQGQSSPAGLNTSLMAAMTTFSLLLYRWVQENPFSEEVLIHTSRLENPEITQVFQRLGFEPFGSGMKLNIRLIFKKP